MKRSGRFTCVSRPRSRRPDRRRGARARVRAAAGSGGVGSVDTGRHHGVLAGRPISAARSSSRTWEPTATSAVVGGRGAVRPRRPRGSSPARSNRAAGDRGSVHRRGDPVRPRRESAERRRPSPCACARCGAGTPDHLHDARRTPGRRRSGFSARPRPRRAAPGGRERAASRSRPRRVDRSRRGSGARSVSGSSPSLSTVA